MELLTSPVKLIGSLIYRTREALNNNPAFLQTASQYEYDCFSGQWFNLWHYPGTANEISNTLLKFNESPNASEIKFPAVFNFQPVRQDKIGKDVVMHFNLAFVAQVLSTWTTEERDYWVFDKVLRPIYREFMNQVSISKYFISSYGYPSHKYYEVFTTGSYQDTLLNKYGDHVDAIEIHDLKLAINKSICIKDIDQIEKENGLVS